MRTCGTITRARSSWVVEAKPHVMSDLRRLFPRAVGHGQISLAHNDATCRDLVWFLQRYPMTVSDDDRSTMVARAQAKEMELESAAAIIGGDYERRSFPLAIAPRDYQVQAAMLALATGGVLCADDLGLGKSIVAICTISAVEAQPAVIVCQTHLQAQWVAEIRKFAPHLTLHRIRRGSTTDAKGKPYVLVQADGTMPDVIVISYSKLAGWAETLAQHYRSVVYDEIQELRHPGTAKHNAAKHLSESVRSRLGLSASPIYNYGGEFYSIMDVLRPGCLGTRSEFLSEWCHGSDDDGGKKATIADPRAFGSYLAEQALMIRRTRADVGRELPPVERILHPIESDPRRLREVHDTAARLAEVILSDASGEIRMRASAEFSNELRQATGVAKAPFVADFVDLLLQSGEPVLLYGWHHAVYDIWAERLRSHNPAFYTGEETEAQKLRSFSRFSTGETNLFIGSLRSGAGLNGLQDRARVIVFGELDWSPKAMDQCVGRLHRDGQQSNVLAYYLLAEGGVDPYMVEALGIKRQQHDLVVDYQRDDLVVGMQASPDRMKRIAQDYLRRTGAART